MVAHPTESIGRRSLADALFNAWAEPDSAAARARTAVGTALLSDGPRPELANRLELFGQFVGSWDLDVTAFPANGEPVRETGEWYFGWALDGRAIIDVWVCPRRDLRLRRPDAGDHGVTLRFFDPDIDAWRSTWIGPVRRVVQPFVARQIGDEIVLAGSFAADVETRWVFSEITEHSFHWRHETSSDGWNTRSLHLEMHATRQAES